MPTDDVAPPWALRYTLISVTDLERSVAFYKELGSFDEIARDADAAMLGDVSPESFVLFLRRAPGDHPTRHGQQSLGLRSIAFNVGTLSELNRIESVLRGRNLFTARRQLEGGTSELLLGRDPDNSPLAFLCYPGGKTPGPDYYREISDLVYSQDA